VRLHALHGARTVRRQKGRHGAQCVIALIDETVVALGGGPVTFCHGAERLPRLRGLHSRAVDQPLAQAFVAQHRTTELLAGPGVAVQTLPRLHCDQSHGLSHPHARAAVRDGGIAGGCAKRAPPCARGSPLLRGAEMDDAWGTPMRARKSACSGYT